MIAFIPFLCPWDDILILMLFPALGIWLKTKFKWCRKKDCHCKCHDPKTSKDSLGTLK